MNLKQTYFSDLAGRWDQLPVPPEAPGKLARFAARALGEGGHRILDVGCGTGILLPYLGAAEVVELDFAEAMLRRGRAKAGSTNVQLVCAEAQRAPFRRASFDRVLCFNALPHLAPVEEAAGQMLACLSSGGLLSVGHLMASAELNRFHAGIGGAVGDDRLPPARELAELLALLGAEVVCAEEEPGWYFVQARRS